MERFNVLQFLEEYRKFPCLWKKNNPDFKNRVKREQAEEQLLLVLGLSNVKELRQKIRSIRCTYNQEVAKIRKSMGAGSDAGDVYKPKLVWFSAADSFLRQNFEENDSESNVIRCTASIIREDWLLGAAHCYVIDGIMVVPEDVVIVAGVTDFLDMLSPYRQNRLARHIYIHPKYEEEVLSSSDLAVVNVASFQKTLFVNTIPVSGDPFALETEVRCMASGWGDHKENSNNTVLRKLPVVAAQSETICHGLKPYQRFNMLCLKKNHGKGLCDGDSGGPLVCDDKVVGVAHQVYTEKSKWEAVPDMGCGARDIVHTYMFTCPYLNWIRLFIPEVPPKPPECFIPNRHSWVDSSQFAHTPPDPDNTLFGFPISPLN